MKTLSEKQDDVSFERLIHQVLDQQYGYCNDFFHPEVVAGLRQQLIHHYQAGAMHPAGVGANFDYQKNAAIRGDVIKWIEPDSDQAFEQIFMEKIQRLIKYLNETCYTSINDFEFHYARYEAGSFYKRHLDQFKSAKGRKFSFVLYLNEDWAPENDGRISLFIDQHRVDSLFPKAGRVLFFRSDQLEHEVHASVDRSRMSIAGWLKNS
ncbi:2OG-Fe(II) oxygenase [Nonlabens xiamenensis]|uniref:2OG-Fe(II) oxygenase n=1 Tax=Nonlabens xiamenensis TaxID=2341043 RepID=UPI00197D152A|nr:2OG-Fe(II) oxygenase [Nonlabens xiamenensis]